MERNQSTNHSIQSTVSIKSTTSTTSIDCTGNTTNGKKRQRRGRRRVTFHPDVKVQVVESLVGMDGVFGTRVEHKHNKESALQDANDLVQRDASNDDRRDDGSNNHNHNHNHGYCATLIDTFDICQRISQRGHRNVDTEQIRAVQQCVSQELACRGLERRVVPSLRDERWEAKDNAIDTVLRMQAKFRQQEDQLHTDDLFDIESKHLQPTNKDVIIARLYQHASEGSALFARVMGEADEAAASNSDSVASGLLFEDEQLNEKFNEADASTASRSYVRSHCRMAVTARAVTGRSIVRSTQTTRQGVAQI